jgi:hypothetical protein
MNITGTGDTISKGTPTFNFANITSVRNAVASMLNNQYSRSMWDEAMQLQPFLHPDSYRTAPFSSTVASGQTMR